MQPEQLSSLLIDLKRRPLHRDGESARSEFEPSDTLESVLPHRDPFLLLDAVEAVDLSARTARGRRLIRPEDPVLAGHFPGAPSYPAALQLEMMGQLGLFLARLVSRGSLSPVARASSLPARVLRTHHAMYITPIRPGEALQVHASIVEQDELTVIVAGQLIREDVITAVAVQELYLEA